MIEEGPQISQEEALQQIIEGLPLETCEYKTDPVTNIKGRFAPEGRIFRITGRFTLDWDVSKGNMTIYVPIQSVEGFIADNQEKFNNYLKKTDEDEQKALELLVEDNDLDPPFGDMPPTSFEGKWLHIVNGKSKYLYVRQEVQPYLDDAFECTIENLTPGSDKKNPLKFKTYGMPEHASYEWTQPYAEAILGFCKVKLVEYEEPRTILVYKSKIDNTTIQLPEPDMDSTAVFAFVERQKGIKLTEKEKLEYMRDRRKTGKPLRDDPMVDFALSEKPKILQTPKKEPPLLRVLIPSNVVYEAHPEQSEKSESSSSKLKGRIKNFFQRVFNNSRT
jgi:hypothetical protein